MATTESSTLHMLRTHPRGGQIDESVLVECIQAAMECHQSCTTCADACLAENMVAELRSCIRLNLDCADICVATTNVMSRRTETDWGVMRAQVNALLEACRINGAECEKHASKHEHCRVCAQSCRRCEDACRRMLQAIPAA